VPPAVALINYMRSGILWRIFCQTETFRGVFSPYISFITLEGSRSNKRAVLHFRGFFNKTGIFLYIVLISPKGTAKLRWAVWGAEDIIFFRVPRSAQ
jgi:hypothetical protein